MHAHLDLTFEDEEGLLGVVVRVLGAFRTGRQKHVREGEPLRRDGAVVVLVVTGGARSDVADLCALEAIAGLGLESECVPVLMTGAAAEDQRIGEFLQVRGLVVECHCCLQFSE